MFVLALFQDFPGPSRAFQGLPGPSWALSAFRFSGLLGPFRFFQFFRFCMDFIKKTIKLHKIFKKSLKYIKMP
jgi:hypothetical protein